MKKLVTLEKFSNETRLFACDFSKQPEVTSSTPATLLQNTATVTAKRLDGSAAPELVFGAPFVTGFQVRVLVSGGTAGIVYVLLFNVSTDGNAVLSYYGKLMITNPNTL